MNLIKTLFFRQELTSFDLLIRKLDSNLSKVEKEALRKPISTSDISAFEQKNNVILPEDYVKLLRWHDGVKVWMYGHPEQQILLHQFRSIWKPNQVWDIQQTMDDMNELLKYGDIDDWDTKWLPFFWDYNGNDVILDLSEEWNWKILYRDHEVWSKVIFENIHDWFSNYLDIYREEFFSFDDYRK